MVALRIVCVVKLFTSSLTGSTWRRISDWTVAVLGRVPTAAEKSLLQVSVTSLSMSREPLLETPTSCDTYGSTVEDSRNLCQSAIGCRCIVSNTAQPHKCNVNRMNNNKAISSNIYQEQSSKGEEGGVGVGGCHGSVAEHWWLKPEALGLTPGSTTFLLSLCCFKGLRTVTAQIVIDLTLDAPCCDVASM